MPPAARPKARASGTSGTHLPARPAADPAEPLPAPQRPAIGAPKQELHLHFHGVTAEEVAAILADVNRDGSPRA
jgi:hypothetical protein